MSITRSCGLDLAPKGKGKRVKRIAGETRLSQPEHCLVFLDGCTFAISPSVDSARAPISRSPGQCSASLASLGWWT